MCEFTFDQSFKSNSDGLPAALAAQKDRVFYARRPLGMNVQFIREDGLRDEWSFNSTDRAQAFAAGITAKGRPAVISE